MDAYTRILNWRYKLLFLIINLDFEKTLKSELHSIPH